MTDLQGWQKVAREIGDYDRVHLGSGQALSGGMLPATGEHVGDWLPAEAAAREILRLRERNAVLEEVLDAAEDAVNWVDPRRRHPLFVAVLAAAAQQQEADR